MASKDNEVDVFWTSHIDSSKVGSVESLPTGEAQHAVRSGLARAATAEDRLTADTTALSEAVVMDESMPTPQTTCPSMAHSR